MKLSFFLERILGNIGNLAEGNVLYVCVDFMFEKYTISINPQINCLISKTLMIDGRIDVKESLSNH